MKQPLLSIVIPTKDRYQYLKPLLVLINSFESDDVEVVIQDNTEKNDEILDYLSKVKIPNIVYNHIPNQIPISLNCDKAILNSNGKYVCFIGDDDGITKLIIDCVEWMDRNEAEIVVPAPISYNWPDAFSNTYANDAGILSFNPFKSRIQKVSTKDSLNNAMKLGFVERHGLPLLYHGIVRRDTLNRIYDKAGTFFPGQSPDIANGVALCLVCDTFFIVDLPIVVSGAGSRHGGDIDKMKNKAADIDDLPFLSSTAKQEWESVIPKIWTGETVWCDSATKALRKMGRTDLIEQVNYEYMLGRFVAYHFPLRRYAYSIASNKFMLSVRVLYLFVVRCLNAFVRIFRTRTSITGSKKQYTGVSDILKVAELLYEENYDITILKDKG